MAKKVQTKAEDLKIKDGDFVDYSGFDMCRTRPCCQRKVNFNVVWFTLGTVTGMCITAGMLICGFMLH